MPKIPDLPGIDVANSSRNGLLPGSKTLGLVSGLFTTAVLLGLFVVVLVKCSS